MIDYNFTFSTTNVVYHRILIPSFEEENFSALKPTYHVLVVKDLQCTNSILALSILTKHLVDFVVISNLLCIYLFFHGIPNIFSFQICVECVTFSQNYVILLGFTMEHLRVQFIYAIKIHPLASGPSFSKHVLFFCWKPF